MRKRLLRKTNNEILDSLPIRVQDSLAEHLKPTEFPRGDLLQEAGRAVKHVYFPTAGMISLLAITPSGEEIETAIVGREGVACGSVGRLDLPAFTRAIMQIAGEGFVMRATISTRITQTILRCANASSASKPMCWYNLRRTQPVTRCIPSKRDFAAGCFRRGMFWRATKLI